MRRWSARSAFATSSRTRDRLGEDCHGGAAGDRDGDGGYALGLVAAAGVPTTAGADASVAVDLGSVEMVEPVAATLGAPIAVTLGEPAQQDVIVCYATSDAASSATSGVDYTEVRHHRRAADRPCSRWGAAGVDQRPDPG